MNDQDREGIIRKIKGLLAKTVDRGASPEEAEAAMAVAQRLMARYAIGAELVQDEDGEARFGEMGKTQAAEFNGRIQKWQIDLLTVVGRLNGCSTFVVPGGSRPTAWVVGTEFDRATAVYLFTYFRDEIERLRDLEVARLRARARPYWAEPPGRSWHNSFRWGAVVRLTRRLEDAVEEARQEARQDFTAQGMSLMVVDQAIARRDARYETADARVKEDCTAGYSTEPRINSLDHRGLLAGDRAAQTIDLKPSRPGLSPAPASQITAQGGPLL